VSHNSWTHLLARRAVQPLLGTWVTPNHLTTLRLLTGLVACAGIAEGTRPGAWWGGTLWLLSAFLDRADGELAREGKMMTVAGHQYDFRVDVLVNLLFFVAAGVGLRVSWLGSWAIPLGLITGAALLGSSWLCELLEQRSPPGTKAYSGWGGFDPDDALYLMGPLAWVGWLAPILIGASVGATAVLVLTGLRLRHPSVRM
jgi:archaetidylinositol phosphate synthase